jgi:pyruvate kinase
LSALRDLATESEESLGHLHPLYTESARNLLHYLALRRRDVRPLQARLAKLGLSSLGRAESHVLATLDAVVKVLHDLLQRPWQGSPHEHAVLEFEAGQQLLKEHTKALLGSPHTERGVLIMVTMSTEAADDYMLVHNLLKAGMNCMRINCAHDSAKAWSRMIEHLRRAEQATHRSCRILMDLAGPKLRTGPLESGPAVIKFRPRRDSFGRVTQPARVWLSARDAARPPPPAANACLPVPGDWLTRLAIGDRIKFTDARGAFRTLKVVDVTRDGAWAEAKKVAYVIPGTVMRCRPKREPRQRIRTRVGDFPPRETTISLRQGDLLILTRRLERGRPAAQDSCGQVLSPASIGCTFPEIFEDVRAGERIWFDDGKIGGIIEKTESDRLYIRITQTRAQGAKLGSDKGINLPDSALRLSAMTAKDIEDLTFIVQHADMVALSFANGVADVELLQEHLTRLGDRRPGIVLKIETRRGFEYLPAMLLAAMRSPCCGVMIARGDLAVECGFERLAEVQEEILWLCEAAHVPVIWATQVLESLAKEGLPSRAEITDVAMGQRAECVMLNKGPHIVEAVQALDDILRRMQGHQNKKQSMLRELRLARSSLRG